MRERQQELLDVVPGAREGVVDRLLVATVGILERAATGVKADLQSLKTDLPAKAKEQVDLLKDPTKTQVFTSIFRHKHDDTPRNRALGVLSKGAGLVPLGAAAPDAGSAGVPLVGGDVSSALSAGTRPLVAGDQT